MNVGTTPKIINSTIATGFTPNLTCHNGHSTLKRAVAMIKPLSIPYYDRITTVAPPGRIQIKRGGCNNDRGVVFMRDDRK